MKNRHPARKGFSYYLRRAFVNPFTVILFVLAVISFITDVLLASNFSRNMTTTLIILCMLLIGGLVRLIQEMKSKRVVEHLRSLLHPDIMVKRKGVWSRISSYDLSAGDIVRLEAGDRVPADIRLTRTDDLFVSQSALTGESAILEKRAKRSEDGESVPGGKDGDLVFMGSVVIGGTGEGVVTAVGEETVYGGWDPGQERGDGFDRGANSIAWVMIRFMAVLVPGVFLACGLTRGNWASAFPFALSVAVGITPELLPMVINACLARGSAVMSRKQTVVKNINAMQAFGSMDVLCVDKTGTLTGDVLLPEYYMDILGNESREVLDMACLNSLYHSGIRNHIDTAILKCREMPAYGSHFAEFAAAHPKLDERPFDHERRIASVLVKNGAENLLIVKGNVDEVCRRCKALSYKGRQSVMEDGDLSGAHAIVDEMSEDGMKVLAVACRTLPGEQTCIEEERDLVLMGYLAFFDAPKQTASEAIGKLRDLHVKIKVLTGDQKKVAVSVCTRLGMDAGEVLTGEELDLLSEDERLVRIEKTSVFAELSPAQKALIVRTLRSNGHTTGFLGDGINDLPAMAGSDVGISVDTAAEAVQECADVLLLKKDLNVLEKGILEGRKAFANMSKYIRITASSNFGNILSIVIASVFLPFFPMTSVQLLLLNLLYDTLCLVLPWDHVDADALERPSEWSGRTLGRFMRFFGPISSVFDILTFLFLFFVFCPSVCGGSYAALEGTAEGLRFVALFQTGWFLESMWTQILILHLLRTKKIPILQSRPSLPVMIVTILGVLFFTVLTFTPIGGLIGLTALPVGYFGYLIVTVSLYLLLVTIAKSWYLKKYTELF